MRLSRWSAGAAALLAALTLIAACVSSAPKSAKQTQADEETAQRVYSALNADPTYYFRHVNVRVDGGVVQLSGYIWSIPAIYRAKQIAAGVPGVTRVVNAMELEREGTHGGGGHSGSG
jgi:osmotically-inducible protein OsmY